MNLIPQRLSIKKMSAAKRMIVKFNEFFLHLQTYPKRCKGDMMKSLPDWPFNSLCSN